MSMATLTMSDVSGQRRLRLDLAAAEDVSGAHNVSQAVEHYVDRMLGPEDDRAGRWWAYSRGVKLDNKDRIEDLPEEDDQWLVMPEVSAGRR